MALGICATLLILFLICVPAAIHAEETKPVTANVIREYLLTNSPWVDREKTVDTIKTGDGDKPIHKAAVCWYPSIENLRKAQKEGCDLIVTHEPTFWEHAAPEQQWRGKKPGLAKSELLEKSGIVVLRAHDSWDQWPEIGIRDSWAAFLGFGPCIYTNKDNRFYGVYEVVPQTLRMFAQEVSNRIKKLGEDSVQVMGDPNRTIAKVAIGVGCITPGEECLDAGADAILCCYDGASYWSTRERLHESGAAVLTMEHGSTEMPGIENLCKHLAEKFPSVKFQYIAQHPRTWTVKGL
jgi:putative NIF3 family GTP cyclohydrolase 1 type 2